MMDYLSYCDELLQSSSDERISRRELAAFSAMDGLNTNQMYNVLLAIIRSSSAVDGEVSPEEAKIHNRVLAENLDLAQFEALCQNGDSPTYLANVARMINSLPESTLEACVALVCATLVCDGPLKEKERAFLLNFH